MLSKKYSKLIVFNVLLILFLTCQPETESADVINNNYVIAEFQEGILPYSGYSGCDDTAVVEGSPYTNYNFGGCQELQIGRWTTTNNSRWLIKFDISAIPAKVTVKKAYLTLCASLISQVENTTLNCYKKTNAWTEDIECQAVPSGGGATWITPAPAGGGNYSASSVGSLDFGASPIVKYYSLEISASVVQDWLNNSGINYGLLIKSSNETTNNNATFYSSESIVSRRPKLTVYYTP